MPKRRSDVWYHFTHQETGRATCNYCNTLLSYTGGSTGNLARHLKKKHHGEFLEKKEVGTMVQELLNCNFEETQEVIALEADPVPEPVDAVDANLSASRKALLKTNTAVAELLRLCRTCESSASSRREMEQLKIQQMKEMHDVKMKILQTDLKIKEELLKSIQNGTVPIPDAVRFLEVQSSQCHTIVQ